MDPATAPAPTAPAWITVGTAVQLPSGGPAMTVVRVSASEATCVWFHEGELRREHFPHPALVPMEADRASRQAAKASA